MRCILVIAQSFRCVGAYTQREPVAPPLLLKHQWKHDNPHAPSMPEVSGQNDYVTSHMEPSLQISSFRALADPKAERPGTDIEAAGAHAMSAALQL